jgi:hypothetical protein
MDSAEQPSAGAVAFLDDDRAFAVVARLRHARRGKPIAFRGGDLGALSMALGFDPERVEERIADCWDAHLASRVRDKTMRR